MAVNFQSEHFSEPFDPANFVERISANVVGGGTKGGQEGFDPTKLCAHFVDAIRALQLQSEETNAQICKLEQQCTVQEQKHKERAADVERQYREVMSKFHNLDDRINSVATKVVHLGDQLENISIPRQRVREAEHAIQYFDEFFHTGKELSPVFTDKSRLHEAASVIHQLLMVADELPKEKFERIQRKIQEKYSEIEQDLVNEFINAFKVKDVDKMWSAAKTLLPFKNYHQCYDELIKMSTEELFPSSDVFVDVYPACLTVQDITAKVFEHNAEHVLAKFVQHVFDKKLSGYIYTRLERIDDEAERLKELTKLFSKSKETNMKLSELRLGSDSTFLDRISKPMFSKYLKTYISDELQYLEEESLATLNRFYNSINHVKKDLTQNFMSDMPDSLKELQKKIPGRDKNVLKDILLCQDVALTLLQENKLSIRRAEMLSTPSALAENVFNIFQLFLKYLGEEHFLYAIEVHLQYLPLLEPKSPPELLFLNVLNLSNTIFHLVEKHFTDFINPTVGSSTIYGECANRKRELVKNLEAKLNTGMERILTSMVNYLKFLLTSEQKKSDFRLEGVAFSAFEYTRACKTCCGYIKTVLPKLQDALDGKNLEVFLTELGTRFHKILLEHLYQFTFSYTGATIALFDVNEYRHTFKLFKVPLLNRIFEVLSHLVNLLVMQPDNLKGAGDEEQLIDVDKSVLQQFIQLRTDFKTLKIGKIYS